MYPKFFNTSDNKRYAAKESRDTTMSSFVMKILFI